MTATKFGIWVTGEDAAVAAAGTLNLALAALTATNDLTIVGGRVEIDMCADYPAPVAPDGSGDNTAQGNVTGHVRLFISRAGQTLDADPLTTSQDVFSTGTAGTFNDEDTGDTWMIAPFVLSHSSGARRIVFDLRTARKLRKGDICQLVVSGTNLGPDAIQVWASATWVVFVVD